MQALKLTQIGNSVGLILSKEVLARLKLEKGDTVYLTDAPGSVNISPNNPDFATQMELARQLMREHRDVLKELAK